ncbi:MAG: VirB8/TrbF family protein [Bryobacterales bacterium]|nr:VirB8/TrbF family protein [Bryobacterales bacterium]MDE0296112.1 VirB8/TrbF family protein [Bryobacterales bacterium]
MNEKNVREYAEAWAAHASAARTLRWIVGALIVVLLVTSIGWLRSAAHEPQPLFVRVDDVGRAEVVDYEALQFDKDPVSPVTKFFLARFVRDHYERRRGGVREAWTRSLYFLTQELAQSASATDAENIAAVISGQASEIVMENLTLRITPSEEPPFTAIATYTLIYQRRGTELGRELWSTEIRFHFLDGVPSEYVLVNPIGLSVSYLRADRAVSES